MTQDFVDEFIRALRAEGKLFVIAVFPPDMSSCIVDHNIDEAKPPNAAINAVKAIQCNLDLPQG